MPHACYYTLPSAYLTLGYSVNRTRYTCWLNSSLLVQKAKMGRTYTRPEFLLLIFLAGAVKLDGAKVILNILSTAVLSNNYWMDIDQKHSGTGISMAERESQFLVLGVRLSALGRLETFPDSSWHRIGSYKSMCGRNCC